MGPFLCDIRALGGSPVACGAVVFRHRGQLHVTAIVKATFSLVNDAVMTLAAPSEIVVKDRFFKRNLTNSLEAASDLVPYRPRVDVTFIGHAYAPGGAAAVGSARLAVFRDGALVDKSVHVYGDRRKGAAPVPFERMPIVYERAYSVLDDPSSLENPVGIAQPNIVDPRDPKRPVGFGPISRYWRGRKRLLGTADARGLDAPIAEIPDAFDWSYFQAAPPDQQVDTLRGDEWIVLDGLHPKVPRIASRLPSAVAVARVYRNATSGGGEGEPLSLLPDALVIDGDRQVCDIVWRGRLPVSGDAALSSLRILTALELPGQSVAWPPQPPEARPAATPDAIREVLPPPGDGTMVADPEDASPAKAATPFDGKRPSPAHASPYAQPSGPVARDPHAWSGTLVAPDDLPANATPFDGTLALPGGLDAAPARASTPFEGKPSSPAHASPYARPEGPVARAPQDWTGTLVPPDVRPAPPSLPVSPAPAIVSFQAPVPLQAPTPLQVPAPSQLPAPRERTAAQPLHLAWFEPAPLPVLRKDPRFSPFLDALADRPLDGALDDPELAADVADVEERREVFEILARASAIGEEAVTLALADAARDDGRLVQPIVVVAGELVFGFDELQALEATISAAAPYVGASPEAEAILALANELLRSPGQPPAPAVAEGVATRIRETFEKKGLVPTGFLDAQSGRALLRSRHYQQRSLLGGRHVRALLHTGSSRPIPAYLASAAAAKLPASPRLQVKMLAVVHPALDHQETHPAALRAVALGLVVRTPSARS